MEPILKKVVIAAVLYIFVFGTGPVPAEEQDPGQKIRVPEISRNGDIGPLIDIKEFIVNIISEDENHYVKAAFTIELNKDEALEEMDKRMSQIRDAILLLVGNKTYEELHDLQGKQLLMAELERKINSFLQEGKVKAIYVTDFVVQ